MRDGLTEGIDDSSHVLRIDLAHVPAGTTELVIRFTP